MASSSGGTRRADVAGIGECRNLEAVDIMFATSMARGPQSMASRRGAG
jgi:hypothetical protein